MRIHCWLRITTLCPTIRRVPFVILYYLLLPAYPPYQGNPPCCSFHLRRIVRSCYSRKPPLSGGHSRPIKVGDTFLWLGDAATARMTNLQS